MSTQVLQPIRPNQLLAEEAVVQLRQAIVEGRLQPGEHLAENGLAQQLGISRSPVREALRLLEREGLVVGLPNRGTFVRKFSAHDVEEIFALRVAIESLAAEWAIERLNEADFQELEKLLEVQRAAVAAGDMQHLNEADINFHEYICRRSGHSRLIGVWQGIRSQCLTLFHWRLRAYPDYVPQTVVTDHEQFLQAFSQRDLARVLELHREVNRRVVREIKEMLARVGDCS